MGPGCIVAGMEDIAVVGIATMAAGFLERWGLRDFQAHIPVARNLAPQHVVGAAAAAIAEDHCSWVSALAGMRSVSEVAGEDAVEAVGAARSDRETAVASVDSRPALAAVEVAQGLDALGQESLQHFQHRVLSGAILLAAEVLVEAVAVSAYFAAVAALIARVVLWRKRRVELRGSGRWSTCPSNSAIVPDTGGRPSHHH